MTSIILILCSVLTALALAEDSFRTKCLDFTPEAVVFNSTRRLVEYVPAGTNLTFPNNDASCARPSQIVYADICRLALTIPTSNRSSVIFEIWLPRDTAWTGRYLATGNGGIDGCTFSCILWTRLTLSQVSNMRTWHILLSMDLLPQGAITAIMVRVDSHSIIILMLLLIMRIDRELTALSTRLMTDHVDFTQM